MGGKICELELRENTLIGLSSKRPTSNELLLGSENP